MACSGIFVGGFQLVEFPEDLISIHRSIDHINMITKGYNTIDHKGFRTYHFLSITVFKDL
jgi:hypothetical protein